MKVVQVQHVSKSFRLPHERHSTLKRAILNIGRTDKTYEVLDSLKDVSFDIEQGEFFGIVGKNGSGKSTLLKLLSNIYTPTSGTVATSGRLAPFIELGVGFNPELSGRDNVFLNGAIFGMSRSDVQKKYDQIVAFAELERFMDQKLKNYSSGMQVRLAFSIAIQAESDILIMDEVLAVGDAAFQKKCFDTFWALKKAKKTIILVTHDMGNVEKFCDRVLMLDAGKVVGIMSPHEAAAAYARANIVEEPSGPEREDNEEVPKTRWGTGKVKIDGITVNNGSAACDYGKPLDIKVDLIRPQASKKLKAVVGLAVFDQYDNNVLGPNSSNNPELWLSDSVTYHLDRLALAPGKYKVTVAVYDEMQNETYDHRDREVEFEVIPGATMYGMVELPHSWTV